MAEAVSPLPLAPAAGAPAMPASGTAAFTHPTGTGGALLADFAAILGNVESMANIGVQPTTPGAAADGSTPSLSPQSGSAPLPQAVVPLARAVSPEATPIAISAQEQSSEQGDSGPEAEEPSPALASPDPTYLAAPLPMPAPHAPPKPASLASGPGAKEADDEAPPITTAAITRRDTAPLSLLTASPGASALAQTAQMADSATQLLEPQDTAHGSSPPLAIAQTDQSPMQPAAARSAMPVISTALGRFGEELGIAIARHASTSANGPAETLTLRLDPPEHGRIEVTLSFEDGGPLRAVVAASQPGTLDLLRRDSADLSRALGQAGIGTDAQSFSFSAHSQSGGRGHQQGQSLAPQSAFADARLGTPEEALPISAPEYRPLHMSGTLNLIA